MFDDDIRAPDERLESAQTGGLLQIDGDGSLATVQHCEIDAVGSEFGTVTAHLVADTWPLDLDYFGAGFGEKQSGKRPGQESAEIEHADPGKRLHIRLAPFLA